MCLLTKLTREELDQIAAFNRRVKAMQHVLLYGDYYRLRSPFEGNECAFMSVSEDQSEAVVTHVFAQAVPDVSKTLLRLRGLNPQWDYRDEDTGRVYGGDELMEHGIVIDRPWGDYKGEQFRLTRVE